MKLKVKSEASNSSENIRLICKIKGNSLAMRCAIYGIGINDADYVTQSRTKERKMMCPAYAAWTGMLRRACSEEFHKRKPTYKDVKVCDEWKYFMGFREWFIKNHVDGYQLDKDLLVIDNKIYSPETCTYAPNWLNSFTISCKSSRGDYLVGVYWNKQKNKFKAQCCNPITKKAEHLGYFSSEEDAYEAWLKRKLELALELKPEMDEIDLRIYHNVVEIIKNMK